MAEAVKNPEIIPFAALGDGAALWNFGMQQFQAGLAAQVEFLGNLQTATETYWRHRRQNLEDAATSRLYSRSSARFSSISDWRSRSNSARF